jgi:RNA polymerase sigma-70 factor (ECF subfamily)
MDHPSRLMSHLFSAARDEADWEAHFRDLYPRVYNFFRFRVGDDLLAEDLTATTFERAWGFRKRFDGDTAPYQAWLFGIARKVAVEYFRRQKASRRGDRDLPASTVEGRATEEEVTQQLEFGKIYDLLLELPDREREMVALKYGAGFTNRAIAAATGLSESNVGTLLHRVVSRIRAEIKGDDDG